MITIINISTTIISCLVGDTDDLKVVQNGLSTTIDPIQIFVYYKIDPPYVKECVWWVHTCRVLNGLKDTTTTENDDFWNYFVFEFHVIIGKRFDCVPKTIQGYHDHIMHGPIHHVCTPKAICCSISTPLLKSWLHFFSYIFLKLRVTQSPLASLMVGLVTKINMTFNLF